MAKYELTPAEAENLTELGRDFIRRRFETRQDYSGRRGATFFVWCSDPSTGQSATMMPNKNHRGFASAAARDQYLGRLQGKQRELYAIAKGLH